jgi:hypothetical protein
MGELIDRDQEHLRLIEYGFYVMAGTIAFFSLFALIYVGLGTLFLTVPFPKTGPNDFPAGLIGGILIGIGLAVLIFGFGFAGLMFYAARGLKERKRRILCLVLAGLCCLQIPWGTVLGVLAINVLNRESVIRLFVQLSPPVSMAPPALH